MIASQLNIIISKDLSIKDPISSELGKKILSEGLEFMCEVGLENFTFKKLSQKIGTTEASIYRYFESKNQFLFYLFNYYWAWMEYRLVLTITNLGDGQEKLKRAINLITKTIEYDSTVPYINEAFLQKVIMLESSKTFLSKKVDQENKLGYFKQYKQFVMQLSNIVLDIDPNFPYSHALMSTVIESAFHQRFFAQHLPSLSDNVSEDEKLEDFFYQMAIHTILNYKKNGKI